MKFSAPINIGTNTGASGATLAITVGAAGVPAGATIFVLVTEKSTSGTSGTIADTAGNGYGTITAGNLNALASNGRGTLFAVTQCKALVNTNTITYTRNLSAASCAMSAFYVTGATGAATFTEGLNTATGSTGTITVTSGSLGAGRLVLGALFDSGTSTAGGNATFTNAASFTTPPNEATTGGSGGSRVDGGTLSKAATGTQVYNPTLSSTAQVWFLAALGIIPAPDTEQILDLPPTGAAPPYQNDLRTFTQNLLQNTLQPAVIEYVNIPFDWGTPEGIWWDRFYAQSRVLYLPVAAPGLPPGEIVYDLAPPTPQQPTLSWTWQYNANLIGRDQFPAGRNNKPTNLPPGQLFPPRTRDLQTWLWNYNPNLIGQDRLPVGRIVTDLALGQVPPRALDLRTWLWNYNRNLIGKDALPVGHIITDLTADQRPPWPVQLRNWTWTYNLSLIGKDKLPFRQQDWPNPVAALPTADLRTWIDRTKLLLAAPAALPFNQFDWPLSRTPQRTSPSWAVKYNPNLIGKDRLPFGQQDWPNPRQADYPIDLRSWVDRTKFPSIRPFAQLDWNNPASLSWYRDWSQARVAYLPEPIIPPIPPPPAARKPITRIAVGLSAATADGVVSSSRRRIKFIK